MAVAKPVAVVQSVQGRAQISGTVPTASALAYTINRRNALTQKVSAVRTAVSIPILGAPYQQFDYEIPIGQAVTYFTVVTFADSHTETSPDSDPVTWTTNVSWLKDPANPERSFICTVVELPEMTYDQPQGVFKVMNRRNPVVVSDVRQGASGTIRFATLDLAARAQMLAILAPGQPLLFQSPHEYGVDNLYFAAGNATEARASRMADRAARTWSVEFTEVDAPSIAILVSDFTYGDVVDAYATYRTMLAGELTYFDLLTSPGVHSRSAGVDGMRYLALPDLDVAVLTDA